MENPLSWFSWIPSCPHRWKKASGKCGQKGWTTNFALMEYADLLAFSDIPLCFGTKKSLVQIQSPRFFPVHFAYILYSPSLDRFYVGESADPAQRLAHHLAGHQRYTRRAADWIQVFLMPTASRAEALEVEQALKKSKSRQTLLRYIRGPDNQAAPSAGPFAKAPVD